MDYTDIDQRLAAIGKELEWGPIIQTHGPPKQTYYVPWGCTKSLFDAVIGLWR
jgi:hypothetical protein